MAEAMGDYSVKDDSVREMRESEGLIKTLKLVPNEVSRRSALEESQALSSEQCLFPDRVAATPRMPLPPPPLVEGTMRPNTRAEPGGGLEAGGQHTHPRPESTWGGQASH